MSFLFAFAGLLLSGEADAENGLLEMLRQAKENSIAIKHQESIIRDAAEDISIAETSFYPEVFLEAGTGVFSREDGFVMNGERALERRVFNHIGLSITQTLWDGQLRNHEVEAKKSRKNAEDSRLQYLSQQVLMNTVKAHFNLQFDRAVLKLTEKHILFASHQLDLELQRFDLGEATLTDLSIARAYFGNMEIALNAAKIRLGSSNARYKKQTGSEKVYEISSLVLSSLFNRNIQEVLDIARNEHPLLKAKLNLVDEAEYLVERERAAGLPKLFVEGHATSGTKPNYRYKNLAALGLRLKVPLFQESVVRSRVNQKQEILYRNQLEMDRQLEEILTNVKSLFEALQIARSNERSAKEAARNAKNAFQSAYTEREHNLRSTPDLLELHFFMREAQLRELDAVRSLKVARFALLFAAGLLDDKRLSNSVYGHRVASPNIVRFNGDLSTSIGESNSNTDQWHGLRSRVVVSQKRSSQVLRRREHER